jgi:hypothetical protein
LPIFRKTAPSFLQMCTCFGNSSGTTIRLLGVGQYSVGDAIGRLCIAARRKDGLSPRAANTLHRQPTDFVRLSARRPSGAIIKASSPAAARYVEGSGMAVMVKEPPLSLAVNPPDTLLMTK